METVQISYPSPGVAVLTLNRPKKLNAVNLKMYDEVCQAFESLGANNEVRAIVFTGHEKAFSVGMDYETFIEIGKSDSDDPARVAISRLRLIRRLQASVSSIELCGKPVIAAVSGYCLGAAVDFLSATDIRYCSKSTQISIKEIAYGMTSDIGSIQRLSKLLGNDSWLREMIFTGRNAGALEAKENGFFSKVFENYQDTFNAALKLAEDIADKSPVAMIGCKKNLGYARDHSVESALEFAAYWNAWATQSTDTATAVMAQIQKTKASFPKL